MDAGLSPYLRAGHLPLFKGDPYTCMFMMS
jgi:hypothetical protein